MEAEKSIKTPTLFGELFRIIKDEYLGISHKRMADETGLDPSTISSYATYRQEANPENCTKIINYFNESAKNLSENRKNQLAGYIRYSIDISSLAENQKAGILKKAKIEDLIEDSLYAANKRKIKFQRIETDNTRLIEKYINFDYEVEKETQEKNDQEDVVPQLNYEDFKGLLINYYKSDDFKRIYLLNEKNRYFNIEEIFVNLTILTDKEIEKKESALDSLIDRTSRMSIFGEMPSTKESIGIEDLIKKTGKTVRNVILGKAGIGKTTVSKHIAYKWANNKLPGRSFELIVYVQLRNWNINDKDLTDVIYRQYFNVNSAVKTETLGVFLEKNKEKILFILDGFDEVNPDSRQNLINVVKATPYWIITSRPYGIKLEDLSVRNYYENVGFTDENIDFYIDRYFKNDDVNTKLLKNYLDENQNIKGIAHIPLMLEIICALWRMKKDKHFKKIKSMTELYSKVVDSLTGRYIEIKKSREAKMRVINKMSEVYDFLGLLSFKALEQNKVIFDNDLINNVCQMVKWSVEGREFFENYVLETGLLKGIVQNPQSPSNEYYFPHLTFQEYFAAKYISVNHDGISEYVRSHKFHPHFHIVTIFMAGLLSSHEDLCNKFFACLNDEPKDLVGYNQVLLITRCLAEIGNPDQLQNVDEIVSDVNLWIEYGFEILDKDPDLGVVILQCITDSLKFSKRISEEIIRRFLDKLDRNSGWVKRMAVWILGEIGYGNDLVLQELLKCYNDKHSGVREDCVEALGKLGSNHDKLVSALIESFTDKELTVKTEALYAITKLSKRDNSILQYLLSKLRNVETDYVTKSYCIEALGDIGIVNEYVIKELTNCLSDDNARIRKNAVENLAKLGRIHNNIGDIVLDVFNESQEDFYRVNCSEILSKIGYYSAKVIDALWLLTMDKNEEVQENVFVALGKSTNSDPVVLEKLEDLLDNEDLSFRFRIAKALLNTPSKSEKIINTLFEALGDEELTYGASELIEENISLVTEDKIDLLIEYLDSDEEDVISNAAHILGLSGYGDFRSIEALIETLSYSESEEIKCSIIESLGNVGKYNQDVLKTLLKTARTRLLEVKAAAITALGKIGISNDIVINTLIKAAHHKDLSVKTYAFLSIKDLGIKDDCQLLQLIEIVEDLATDLQDANNWIEGEESYIDMVSSLGEIINAKTLCEQLHRIKAKLALVIHHLKLGDLVTYFNESKDITALKLIKYKSIYDMIPIYLSKDRSKIVIWEDGEEKFIKLDKDLISLFENDRTMYLPKF